jgi:hypothetical protein
VNRNGVSSNLPCSNISILGGGVWRTDFNQIDLLPIESVSLRNPHLTHFPTISLEMPVPSQGHYKGEHVRDMIEIVNSYPCFFGNLLTKIYVKILTFLKNKQTNKHTWGSARNTCTWWFFSKKNKDNYWQSQSCLSHAPLYWYVAEWEILEMRMTLYTSQWKWWLQE